MTLSLDFLIDFFNYDSQRILNAQSIMQSFIYDSRAFFPVDPKARLGKSKDFGCEISLAAMQSISQWA